MYFKIPLFLSVFHFLAITKLYAFNYEEIDMPLEVDSLICPQGCVCQYARFKDLPLSRWINYVEKRHGNDIDDWNSTPALDLSTNPYIKQATCIIQPENNLVKLVQSLPHDLQALILLYTGVGSNKTIKTSELQVMNQLHSLEIRGAQDRTLRLLMDTPLPFLLHANFECITLLGTENSQYPKTVTHPRDIFSYKPRSELLAMKYIDDMISEKELQEPTLKKLNLEHVTTTPQQAYDDIEIVPYEIYKEEVKKARMPRFYGWQSLEILRINDCELNELHFEMFTGLDALQHLVLEHNNIVMLPPYALFGAPKLRTLSLAHNAIQDLHYRHLAGLLELEALDLSYNKLYLLSELTFPPFPKLQVAQFQQNAIKYIFPAAFWVMNTTRSMSFDSGTVALELLNNAPFDTLRLLTNLFIGNISVTTLQQNMFMGLASLHKLRLKGEIHSIEFDAFAHLLALHELDLSHCQLKEVSMDAFIGAQNLQILNLSHNSLTYLPNGIFDEQLQLQQIYLQFNQLQTLPSNFLLQTNLILAQLNGNPWKCSCDMKGWLSRITNKRVKSSKERCITDFLTGNKYDCKLDYSYTTDRRLAPRCANYNDRSLYFVLHKQLRCNKQYVPHWRKVQLATHLKPARGHMEHKQYLKSLRNIKNSIDYVLEQNNNNKQKTNEIDYYENSPNEI